MNAVKTSLNELTDRTIAVDLNFLVLIEVTGDDAQSFLQGQFSNDIAAIGRRADKPEAGKHDPNQTRRCQLNAYCNPKGRVLALIKLVRHTGGFWLIVPAGLADNFVNRLKMYVLRAKVDIEMKPEVALLGRMGRIDPLGGDDAGAGNGIERVTLDGLVPRQILLGEKPAMDEIARAGGHESAPDDRLWRLIDVLSGIPQIYPQTVEAFIPQTINLDLVDGLSFTKGCYPGQEIVARLRYRGKVKQRMLAASVRGVESLVPGDPVYAQQRADQKSGVVVDAVETGDGEYTFSATVPANMFEHGALRVGSASGAELTRIPLPYPAPTEQPG